MANTEEKRMAGDFEIIHAMRIGDREIVLGENPAGTGDERYMCAFCTENGLFASYTEIMVSDDYPELVKLFGERVAEQAEKTRIALNGPKIQGISNAPITAEGCEIISHQHDLKGRLLLLNRRYYAGNTAEPPVSSSYARAALARPPTVEALPATVRSCTPARPRALNGVTFSEP